MPSKLSLKKKPKQLRKKELYVPPIELVIDQLGGKLDKLDGGLFKSREPCYVGMDPSLSCFAIAAVNESGGYYIWEYEPNVPSPITDVVNTRRLIDIRLFIYQILHGLKVQTAGVRKICIEGYSYASKGRAITGLAELRGVALTEIVRVFGYVEETAYPIVIPPNNLKLFASGATKSEKNKMLLSIYKKWNVEPKTDNGADAFGLAQISKRLYSGSTVSGALEYEKQALAKIEGNHKEWLSTKPLKKLNYQKPKPRPMIQESKSKSKMKKKTSSGLRRIQIRNR